MIISGTYDVKHLETLEEKAFCGQAIDSQIITHSKYFSVFSLFFFWDWLKSHNRPSLDQI